jgi:hypothetical protein
MDTIEKVDPRTLRELAFLNASYLYFMASAGIDDLPWIADLAYSRAIAVISEKAAAATTRLRAAKDGAAFGKVLAEGTESIEYHTGQQKLALAGIERLVPAGEKPTVRNFLASYLRNIDEYGQMAARQFHETVAERAKAAVVTVIPYIRPEAPWEKEAASLVPKRSIPGTLFFVEIPQAEWKEVSSPPVFWSAGNWAASSYWWVDGKRNLKEIKRLCEIEAGRPMETFNLVNYYRFLEKYKYVELAGK